jgi:hypothetical protein
MSGSQALPVPAGHARISSPAGLLYFEPQMKNRTGPDPKDLRG